MDGMIIEKDKGEENKSRRDDINFTGSDTPSGLNLLYFLIL